MELLSVWNLMKTGFPLRCAGVWAHVRIVPVLVPRPLTPTWHSPGVWAEWNRIQWWAYFTELWQPLSLLGTGRGGSSLPGHHRLVSQFALPVWSTCPVRFLHKTLGRWNFILEKGWFCSFSRVVTSQKCHDGQVIKENSIMMIALNRKHGKLLQQWSSKQNIDTSLGVVQALIRNAFFYLHQSNQWVQCFYFFLMHVLRWRKCLQTWFCYTNAHHIFMVYF